MSNKLISVYSNGLGNLIRLHCVLWVTCGLSLLVGCSTKSVVKPPVKQQVSLNKPLATVPTYTPLILDQQITKRSDGCYVVSWSPSFGPNQVWVWTNQDFIETKQLDNSLPYTKPVSMFNGDRFLVANPNSGIGPVEVNEYDSQTFQWTNVFKFGDSNSRIGCGIPLKNGSSFFINFVTFGFNSPTYAFDIAYKLSLPPAINAVSAWQTNRITLPNSDPGTLSCQMCCCEMDGLVYVFYGFDGSGRIDILVLNGVSVVHQQVNWISRQSGVIAASVEVPLFNAIYDKWNKRILLCYQGVNAKDVGCKDATGNIRLTYPLVVTAVNTNFNATLVKTLPWTSFQDDFPLTSLDPRPDGVYFYTAKQVGCNDIWVSGLISNEGVITTNSEHGELYSMNLDGWVIYKDANTFEHLTKRIMTRPIVRISVEGLLLKLSWDQPNSTDILEGSNDFKSWNVITTSDPPVFISPNDYHFKFFRVIRAVQ